ncbi:phage adsorption protein NrfB [Proteobacteria bacterium 005FR1]|nr:phage adsorption protein NrfB [Proteobacteria bacterium 005FR1]
MYWLVDLISSYLYGLSLVATIVAALLLISGVDDLFIDLVYWCRRAWRAATVYKRYGRFDYRELYALEEKPFAILVPAWQETGVVRQMAELAATTLDYENYHIFVGTYPNDPGTQHEVDQVCARFPNVHKVVCALPGPTSKADCLNNILNAILLFENSVNLSFQGFILHDAEDLVSPLELRLFNYLVARKDLIQIPVYPLERSWKSFTSLTYVDEFAEQHGKDVSVREALAGQVPSAGVGTCFSRRAIVALLTDGDGVAFDVQSLTEDYDVGFRLKQKGMSGIFVRFPVVSDTAKRQSQRRGQRARSKNVICVREFFPDTFEAAVRQKSRWITGIVFQGFKRHRWSNSLAINYFLFRDRKGAVNNFLSFFAMMLFIQLVVLALYQALWPGAWNFMSIFADSDLLVILLGANLVLMANRIIQRFLFVTSYYGIGQGLMSIPRLFWGNLINFTANWRAIRQVIRMGDAHRVAWDKTAHEFPSVGRRPGHLRPLGQILIDQRSLDREQLETTLANPELGLKLGATLVHRGLISAAQLADAIAAQYGVPTGSVDPWQLPAALIERVPAAVALQYAVLPISEEQGGLVLASESGIDPVSLAALARKLRVRISYVIVPKGQVVVGLRRWYVRRDAPDERGILQEAVRKKTISAEQGKQVREKYVSGQLLFAEILTSLGDIGPAAMKALLLRSSTSETALGTFLVSENIIDERTLEYALELQKKLQPSMHSLIQSACTAVDTLTATAPETSRAVPPSIPEPVL